MAKGTGLTETQFVFAMVLEICRCGKIKASQGMPMAADTYRAFLTDNGISFGAPGWAWDEDAARTVAHEYEIYYWEPGRAALAERGGAE